MTCSRVSTQHAITSGLSDSCSECSLRYPLPSPNDAVMPIDTRRNVKFCLINQTTLCKKLCCLNICASTCAENSDLSFLLHAVKLWITCNLHSFRRRILRRILCTIVCGISNSALAPAINKFCLRMKACLTQSTSSSDLLGRPVEYVSPTLPVSANSSYHLILFSSSNLTLYSRQIHVELK
jgi:hypothetical protein